jgi:hypothetical protein
MSTKKSTSIYRKLWREAWSLTWHRKEMWIFGIFTAVLSTGGVIDVALSSVNKMKRSESLLEGFLDSSFIGYELFSQYVAQLQVLGPGRVSYLLIAIVLAGFLIVFMALLSQGALILGIKSTKRTGAHSLREGARAHFWSLMIVGALNKIMMMVLIMLLTLPLFLYFISTTTYSTALFFVTTVILVPAVIIVNIIYMFSVMDVVHNNAHPIDAIHHAVRLFKKQWLATLEYGLGLFFIVFCAVVAISLASLVLMIPYSVIFTATLLSGSMTLFTIVNVILAMGSFVVLLALGGVIVSFQYSAWYLFYKRALHRTHGKKVFSKLLRITGHK